MIVWSALAGGFAGTVVLTSALAGATHLGLTRMDLPFLLGTVFTTRRTRAKVVGYALHFTAGLVFALGYAAMFAALGTSSWWLGAIFGVAHALFAGTTLVNVLLPLVHPHMGTSMTAADTSAFLEPPGFMMLNYGVQSPLVALVAHVAYGAIVGAFVAQGGR